MNTPKACGHTGCQLRTREGCCACLDRRPVQASYMRYVDGRGWQPGGSRQAMYCPHCRVNYPPVVASVDQTTIQMPSRSPPHLPSQKPYPARRQYPAPPSPPSLSANSDTSCKICFDARLEALFLPCAHLSSCASCAVRLFREHPATKGDAKEWEVNGHELLAKTTPSFSDRYGQIGFDALDRLDAPNPVECPLCRTGVRRWIRVYT